MTTLIQKTGIEGFIFITESTHRGRRELEENEDDSDKKDIYFLYKKCSNGDPWTDKAITNIFAGKEHKREPTTKRFVNVGDIFAEQAADKLFIEAANPVGHPKLKSDLDCNSLLIWQVPVDGVVSWFFLTSEREKKMYLAH